MILTEITEKKKYNNYLTDTEKETILQLFNEGYNTVEIGKRLNRHDGTIGRFLKKNNLKARYSKNGILLKDIDDICTRYKNGESANKILVDYSDKINCPETIINIVKRNGIEIRKSGIPSNCNEDYFENIDTEGKAYFLGLLLADGNVHKLKRNTEQYTVQIELMYQDTYIIEQFRDEIESTNTICHYQNDKRNESHFAIGSKKMALDLKRHGVIENKTFHEELNYNIPQHLFHHYIRGIFDGDGTVFILNNKRHTCKFGFYGTHKLVDQIADYLFQTVGITKNKTYDKPTVSFTNNSKIDDIIKFYKYIYKDANFYLKRKKEKFETYFKMKDIDINSY